LPWKQPRRFAKSNRAGKSRQRVSAVGREITLSPLTTAA
jgi:hypothetical protein